MQPEKDLRWLRRIHHLPIVAEDQAYRYTVPQVPCTFLSRIIETMKEAREDAEHQDEARLVTYLLSILIIYIFMPSKAIITF